MAKQVFYTVYLSQTQELQDFPGLWVHGIDTTLFEKI